MKKERYQIYYNPARKTWAKKTKLFGFWVWDEGEFGRIEWDDREKLQKILDGIDKRHDLDEQPNNKWVLEDKEI